VKKRREGGMTSVLWICFDLRDVLVVVVLVKALIGIDKLCNCKCRYCPNYAFPYPIKRVKDSFSDRLIRWFLICIECSYRIGRERG